MTIGESILLIGKPCRLGTCDKRSREEMAEAVEMVLNLIDELEAKCKRYEGAIPGFLDCVVETMAKGGGKLSIIRSIADSMGVLGIDVTACSTRDRDVVKRAMSRPALKCVTRIT